MVRGGTISVDPPPLPLPFSAGGSQEKEDGMDIYLSGGRRCHPRTQPFLLSMGHTGGRRKGFAS